MSDDAPQAVGKQSEFLLMNSKLNTCTSRGRAGDEAAAGAGDVDEAIARRKNHPQAADDVGGVCCGSGVNEFKCIHEPALTSCRRVVGDVAHKPEGLACFLSAVQLGSTQLWARRGLTYCFAFHLDMRWVGLPARPSVRPSVP